MRTLVIYTSIHKGNTAKIARIIGTTLRADIKLLPAVAIEELSTYDLIGLGSGIYFGEHHQRLLAFANSLPNPFKKRVFIFSTSGTADVSTHAHLKKILRHKGCRIAGEFSCKGWDCWGPFELLGGLNKGHPNNEDIKAAWEFAKSLVPEDSFKRQ